MGRKQTEVGEGRWAKPGGCACWGGAAGVLISQSPCVHWSLHSIPSRGWQGSGILGVPAPTPVCIGLLQELQWWVGQPPRHQTEPSTCVSLPCTGAPASLTPEPSRASLSR